MNKLLNYKTKTKNATPPIFTEIVALFFFTNCQRWEYITMWQRAKEAITEFMEKQQEQTTENVIEDMVGIYKDLSREERLEFSKKLQDEENILNSLDMLKYSWGKLVNKFLLLE